MHSVWENTKPAAKQKPTSFAHRVDTCQKGHVYTFNTKKKKASKLQLDMRDSFMTR